MARIRWFTRTSRIVALCSTANFINSADRVIMPIAIVPMTDLFHWSLHDQGLILSAFAVGYFTSQVIGSCWDLKNHQYHPKNVLIISVLLWSAVTFITPTAAAYSLPFLIVCRFLLGLAEGMGLPTIYNLFAHTIPIEERSRAFGYLIAAGSIGQTVATLICPHTMWHQCFQWFGSLGFIWTIVWYVTYPKDLVDNLNETLLPISSNSSLQNSNKNNYIWTKLLARPLLAIYAAHFAMNWSSYIIMQWLPTYLTRRFAANAHSLSLTASPYIVNSILGVFAGHLADSLLIRKQWSILNVRRLMTSIGLIGPALFLAIFGVVPKLWLALILVSVSMGLSAFNSAGHLANHLDVAPSMAGQTFALANALATVPGILCGPVTAALVEFGGGHWFGVFFGATMINLLGAGVYFWTSTATQVV